MVLGFVDAMLFYVGDILAAYGVLLFVGVRALRWKDRTVLVVALLFFALNALPGGGDSLATSAEPPDPSMLPPDPFAAFEARIVVYPIIALLGPIGFACPFLMGVWADPPVHIQGIHQLDRCVGARGKLCGWLSTAASVAST